MTRAARIIALAKAVTAAEAAAQGFVDAETSELSQLDKRELEQLVALADDLATKARAVALAGALLADSTCVLCAAHYGPTDQAHGVCDEGRPLASPHRVR